MKKTITKSDGSTEVVEGTAEEIAEYERKVRGEIQVEAPKPKGPGLLTDELQRLVERFRSNQPWWESELYRTVPRLGHSPSCQITTAQNGWWSVVPPQCTCGLITYPAPGGFIRWYTIQTDSSGNISKTISVA